MALSGLERIASKPRGGVLSVELAPADRFAGAEYDRSADRFASVAAAPFASYSFREDCASYAEEASGGYRQPLVKHTLKMEFPGGPDTCRALAELSEAAGFVAIVTTRAGQRLLAGYSPRFGVQYPLRLAKVHTGSGSRPADFPSVTVVLESTDSEFSKPLRD